MTESTGTANPDNNRWECHFCKKKYSNNYPFKKHLEKCLVHRAKLDHENVILTELKEELKEEFTGMFQQVLNDIVSDMKYKCQTVQTAQPSKRMISVF